MERNWPPLPKESNLRQNIADVFRGVAVGVATVAFVVSAREIFFNEQEDYAASIPPAEAPPSEDDRDSTLRPHEDLGPEVRLEGGYLVNGGVRIPSPVAGGVDCRSPRATDRSGSSPKSVEKWLSTDLADNPSLGKLIDPDSTSTVFFGEETDKPTFGYHKLSDGWALRYNPQTNRYIVFKFEVRERQEGIINRFQGDAMGKPIMRLTLEDLQRGIKLEDDDKELFIQTNGGTVPAGAAGRLRTTLACKE